jgi:hypothetical protein
MILSLQANDLRSSASSAVGSIPRGGLSTASRGPDIVSNVRDLPDAQNARFGELAMFIPLMLLALESSEVTALRTIKLMSGDEDAAKEVRLMIGEKLDPAFEATADLMGGVTGNEIIEGYRQTVAANADRLSNKVN